MTQRTIMTGSLVAIAAALAWIATADLRASDPQDRPGYAESISRCELFDRVTGDADACWRGHEREYGR